MKLFLSGRPGWVTKTNVPLCIPYKTLVDRKRALKPLGPWIIGAIPANTPVPEVADVLDRAQDYGNCVGAGAPFEVGDGDLAVRHQSSVESWMRLRGLGLPVLPTVHAASMDDCRHALRLYSAWGIEIQEEPLVILRSLPEGRWARRDLVMAIRRLGLSPHAHNQSKPMLKDYGPYLQSADDDGSWVVEGRRGPQLPSCTHKSCASCMNWALEWRSRTAAKVVKALSETPLFEF